MIAGTIQKCIESGLFSRVIVSTDSLEIAQISISSGAEAPFVRDPKLSDDFSPTLEVIADAIDKSGVTTDIVCCIYPATPLLDLAHVQSAIHDLGNSHASYIFPVLRVPTALARVFSINEGNMVLKTDLTSIDKRTQDLDIGYFDAGQFYVGKRSAWIGSIPIIGKESKVVILNTWEAVDIDNPEDWHLAEMLFDARARK